MFVLNLERNNYAAVDTSIILIVEVIIDVYNVENKVTFFVTFCETCFSMLCSSCLELTTKNCSQYGLLQFLNLG